MRRALFLVPWPLLFILYMGTQERFFGRWLLPALPALAILAGLGATRLLDLVAARRPRVLAVAAAVVAAALAAQGLYYSVHVDRVLSNDDTRNLARAWMAANIPAGSKVVVEPIVPDAWFTDADAPDAQEARRRGLTRSGRRWIKFPTGRTTVDEQGHRRRGGKGRFVSVEDYERTLRPDLIDAYTAGGFCWVVTGSTQYGRADRAPGEVPRAIRYYRALARRARGRVQRDPLRATGRVRSNSTSTGASTNTRAPTSAPARAWSCTGCGTAAARPCRRRRAATRSRGRDGCGDPH